MRRSGRVDKARDGLVNPLWIEQMGCNKVYKVRDGRLAASMNNKEHHDI